MFREELGAHGHKHKDQRNNTLMSAKPHLRVRGLEYGELRINRDYART